MEDEAEAIAIIGMACRVPGADTPEGFFRNLLEGVESITAESEWGKPLPQAEPAAKRGRGRAAGLLRDLDKLDAGYFGLTPREAEVMDPQQRLFLECCAEALQRAGEDRDDRSRSVGVFAGVGVNTYFLRHVLPNPRVMQGAGAFQAVASNEKDFVSTQTSYRLDLRGPSVSIHTACSTSLVAVAAACDSLLSRQCDVALAGGSSAKPDPSFGFFLDEGGIASPQGACRPFDADADGTVGGSGAGVVVLKRLSDALRDGDRVHAVIRGWAVNNDGAQKPGYTAPSLEGQAAVVAEAQAMAGVEPHTLGYIEAHGTGTPVGDPIEVGALTRVFRESTDARGFCALGAVKANIGHLDAAAGVAGLIKAALAVERGVVPPTLHFRRANPALALDSSPFFVNAAAAPFERRGAPRRAGVSSFGIGGTNAHVILEEAPPRAQPREDARPQLLLLSARTPTALDASAARVAERLDQLNFNCADAAWTLQTGRRRLAHRRAVLVDAGEDAAAALREPRARRSWSAASDARDRDVAFLFPGQGSQHVQMARGLYSHEPAFRADLDRSADTLRRHLGFDIRDVLYPEPGQEAAAAERLAQTELTQPLLFAVEHALAQLWMSWGVRPKAMLGHSIGEYVAATLAGVMPLDDALALVVARGRLMQRTREGAMRAVSAPEATVRAWLDDELSVAAVNDPDSTIVAGAPEAVARFEARLRGQGVEARALRVRRAFHSALMDEILVEFEQTVAKVTLRPPRIPYLSNVTGDWIRPEEATSAAYYARHLRGTVRFADGLQRLLADDALALLEVGPGRTLASLAARRASGRAAPVVSSLPHPDDATTRDALCVREALARLWLAGARIDWNGVHAGARREKVTLPGYPFERASHWLPAVPWVGAATLSEAAAPLVEAAPAPPAVLHARPDLASRHVAPRTPLEEAMVGIWQDVFGFAGIGVEDDFFDLGGHSLLATKMAAQVREAFEVELPLARLFEVRTVAQMARAVEDLLLEKLESMSDEEAERALGG